MEVKFQSSQPITPQRTVRKPVSFGNGYYYTNSDDRIVVGKEVGTAVSTAISAAILAPVVQFFSLKLFNTKDNIPKETVEKIVKTMVEDEKNNFSKNSEKFNYEFIKTPEPEHTTVESLKYMFSDHYKPLKNRAEVHISRPSVLLHETGHAIDWNKSSLGKLLFHTKFKALALMGIITPIVFYHKNSENKNSTVDWFDKHIGTLSFLSFVPTLITEASASLNGRKYLKKFMDEGKEVTPEMLKKYEKRMKWAFGTYAATALLTPVALKLGVMVKDKIVADHNYQGMQQPYGQYYNYRY